MKQFKIKLYSGAGDIANELAILAAKSNGGDTMTLPEIRGFFRRKNASTPYHIRAANVN